MPSARPGEAGTLVLIAPEVLLHILPGHFVLTFDDPDPRLGVHEFKIGRLDFNAVTFEVYLENKSLFEQRNN